MQKRLGQLGLVSSWFFSEKYGLEASESVHIQRRSYFLAIFKIDVTSLKYKKISDKRKLSETMSTRPSKRAVVYFSGMRSSGDINDLKIFNLIFRKICKSD